MTSLTQEDDSEKEATKQALKIELLTAKATEYRNNISLIYADLLPLTKDSVPIRKLFINNLAKRTTYKDLIKLFSKYGNVESCFLRRNEGNNNYAFVTFDSEDGAIRARYTETIKLHNKILIVTPADSWHQPDNVENQYSTKYLSKSNKILSDEQCDQQYIQNDNTDIDIQRQEDECLKHIFLQLPIIDRIRIERVCKRWRAISQKSWQSVNKLDLSHSMWGSFPGTEKRQIDIGILRKVLLRCGPFLDDINLSHVPYPLSKNTLTIVGKLCQNLKKIDVTGLTVPGSGIHSLTKNCNNITKLSLGYTTYMCDAALQNLFKINPSLRYFKAVHSQITGRCLSYLPVNTMEELVLKNCTLLQEHFLSQAIAKLQNLKYITIYKCINISSDIVQAIDMHCKNLKVLEFFFTMPIEVQANNMLHIAQLPNLEVLKICVATVIMDLFLISVASKCLQLKYIDISDCYYVEDAGIAALASLPKLEVLIINGLKLVTDISFGESCNLRRFECRACNFTDKTIIKLIEVAPQLNLLDLSACCYITNETLKKAAAITINRTNNMVLKIFIGGSSVDLDTFDEVSPFLQVVNVVIV